MYTVSHKIIPRLSKPDNAAHNNTVSSAEAPSTVDDANSILDSSAPTSNESINGHVNGDKGGDATISPSINKASELETDAIARDPIVSLPPAPTTTLPIVDAPQSDLREEVAPTTIEQAQEIKAEKHNLDLAADSDLASGLDTTITQSNAMAELNGTTDGASQAATFESQPLSVPPTSDNLTFTSPSNLTQPPIEASIQADSEMMDASAPAIPAKVSREREEDMEDVPSAKRAKVDDLAGTPQRVSTPDIASHTNGDNLNGAATPAGEGSASAAATPGGSTPGPLEAVDDSQKPTLHQTRELQKVIRAQKGTKNGRNFKDSVDKLWPALAAQYNAKVSDPVDLLVIDQKLRDGLYDTLAAFKADVNKLYDNAALFNGEGHVVTIAADIVRNIILAKIPPPEPSKPVKSTKPSTPKADIPRVRRQSRGATTAPATATSQAFAVNPDSGVPIIRRDSTKLGDGGRPKREIHPPKNKDLIYSSRPKKKKFAAELKFCELLLGDIKKPRYLALTGPFALPVDPVSLGIPQYFSIIKNPMDLSTISEKLQNGQYERAKEFEDDFRLMLRNCYKFNPEGTPVNQVGHQLEELFNAEWAKKAEYLNAHTEPAQVASPVEDDSEEEEEEESEEEEVDDEPVSNVTSVAANRLIEEQNKLIDLMGIKKPDQGAIRMQQAIVNFCKEEVDKVEKEKAKAKKKAKPAKVTKKSVAKPLKSAGTKKYKVKNIGVAEKEVISNGIGSLNESEMTQAIKLLKVDFPNLNVEDEVEFDIDQFTPMTLSRLYDLITRTHPELLPAKAPKAEKREHKPAKPKKNKPMSKTEQESKIEHLRKVADQLGRSGSVSDNSNPTVHPCKFR